VLAASVLCVRSNFQLGCQIQQRMLLVWVLSLIGSFSSCWREIRNCGSPRKVAAELRYFIWLANMLTTVYSDQLVYSAILNLLIRPTEAIPAYIGLFFASPESLTSAIVSLGLSLPPFGLFFRYLLTLYSDPLIFSRICSHIGFSLTSHDC